MLNKLNKNNSSVVTIDNDSIKLSKTFMKKNNIKNGNIYDLVFTNNIFDLRDDNRSKYFEWILFSFIDNFVKYYPNCSVLLTTNDSIIKASGNNAFDYLYNNLHFELKKKISGRLPVVYKNLKTRVFKEIDTIFNLDLITLHKNRGAIGSIIIIHEKKYHLADSDFLYELLRHMSLLFND